MLLALGASGILAPPQLPFNGPSERFEQRFGSLHILTRPEPLGYNQFVETTDIKGAAPNVLFSSAGGAFGKV